MWSAALGTCATGVIGGTKTEGKSTAGNNFVVEGAWQDYVMARGGKSRLGVTICVETLAKHCRRRGFV